ncbi:MAG: DNA mismatch repair endonuclease MutL [Butyrivibrio sp.]|nr:DNA mismatch repair endonuclease MutL [Butyrivibrio sp.]
MAIINELDKNTIDQIAAGEVVERPASVVKELVENAIDSGATAVTVEIRDGGIGMIRVSDNGCGIEKSQIRKAFKRHATSKITKIEDLFTIRSLGFRGEALSSIASVAQVDMITKTEEDLEGIRYTINGGEEAGFEDIGAPTGTTLIIRNLFYNTPARKKFLKTPQTEGSYVADIMEHMALDNPSISFHFINNKADKFSTSGNGDLKEIIYRIYGRDVACSLVPIKAAHDGISMEGYLGEPTLNRSNRNFEVFFINGRYVKDKIVSKALEEGYKQYLMQHKFPFVVLHIQMDPDNIDVNVHPAKMEIRFNNQTAVYEFIRSHVAQVLKEHEMIPDALLDEEEDKKARIEAIKLAESKAAKERLQALKSISEENKEKTSETPVNMVKQEEIPYKTSTVIASFDDEDTTEASKEIAPQPFEAKRFEENKQKEESKPVFAEGIAPKPVKIEDNNKSALWSRVYGDSDGVKAENNDKPNIIKKSEATIVETNVQLNMFDEKILTKEHRNEFTVLGQIFDTYWIIAFKDKMFIVDQHAAHEKVNYERMIKKYKEKTITSQIVNPPVIVSLSAAEEDLYLQYREYFEKLGFNIENFGGHEYAMREIPTDLYGCDSVKDMFLEILDDLSHETEMDRTPDVINYKIASMACKASVKGNMKISAMEMETLIDELLTLENPYNCPHGRPTIISMSKYEIDKKFKRIIG